MSTVKVRGQRRVSKGVRGRIADALVPKLMRQTETVVFIY
jgi:hypothetical protein